MGIHRVSVPDRLMVPQNSLLADSTSLSEDPENVIVELLVVIVPQVGSAASLENPPPVGVKNPVELIVPVMAGSSAVSPKNVIEPVIVSWDPDCTTVRLAEPVKLPLIAELVRVNGPL